MKSNIQNIACVIFIFGMFFIFSSVNAQNVSGEKAMKAYQDENYEEAAKILENEIALQLKNNEESSDLYYNLGNAYFRDNELAKAILNYERANLINPGDKDIRHNLEFARTKTEDKIVNIDPFFLQEWFNAVQNLQTSNAWAKLSIVIFLVLIISVGVFLFSDRILIKKTTFYTGIVCLILLVFTNIFAYRLKSKIENRNTAIIMDGSVSVKTSPDENSKELFILHSGTKVKINKRDGSWMEIEIGNGNVGWTTKNKLEVI